MLRVIYRLRYGQLEIWCRLCSHEQMSEGRNSYEVFGESPNIQQKDLHKEEAKLSSVAI